jgi:glycosyltransferase involved in cell wall biosynthesis
MKILMDPGGRLQDPGGVATVVRALTTELSRRHEVQLFLNDWDSRKIKRTTQYSVPCTQCRLRELSWSPAKDLLKLLIDGPYALWQMRAFLKSEQFDIIHLHFPTELHYYFYLLRKLGGPPYIATLHRGDVLRFPSLPPRAQQQVRATLFGAGRVTAVSSWLRDVAIETFPGLAVDVVYNGLPQPVGEGEPVAEACAAERFMLMVANVARYKGIDLAIEAWPTVLTRHPDCHLIVAGEPREDWQRCREMIEARGLDNRVHLIGAVPLPTVYWLMRRAKALVVPSRNEGFGLVLIEAAMLGLPVICSDIPPFLEVLGPDLPGFVVPTEDSARLAEAALLVLDQPAAAAHKAEALTDRVNRLFSAEAMAEQYEALYRSIVSSGGTRDMKS